MKEKINGVFSYVNKHILKILLVINLIASGFLAYLYTTIQKESSNYQLEIQSNNITNDFSKGTKKEIYRQYKDGVWYEHSDVSPMTKEDIERIKVDIKNQHDHIERMFKEHREFMNKMFSHFTW